MPFDRYCVELDGMPLTPRQYKAFAEPNLLTASQMIDKDRKVQEWALLWGKGCLSASTLLTDESSHITRPMNEWAEIGDEIQVRSTYDGETLTKCWASPVYYKGIAPLFDVILSDGRHFRSTEYHCCLTPTGWLSIREISEYKSTILSVGQGDDRLKEVSILSITETDAGDYYDLTVPGPHCYFDAQGILHHNSGKGYLSAKFISYLALIILSLAGDPAVFFGLAPLSPLAAMNVASSEDQARNVFFKYLSNNLRHPIFQDFQPQILADEIRFPNDNFNLYSMHSRSGGLDGYNLIGWVMDEADAMLDTAKRSNAEEVHNVLRSSCNTRMKNRWIGMVTSYPRTEDGFMIRLHKRAVNDPTFYADKAATWEVRPDVSRDDPGIASDYLNDPADARARYECIPMATEDAFIENPEKIGEAIDFTRTPVADVRADVPICVTLANGNTVEHIGCALDSLRPDPYATYFLAGDAGLSGDSFALCVGHINEGAGVAGWNHVCPHCGRDEYVRSLMGSRYRVGQSHEQASSNVQCGVCSATVEQFNMGYNRNLQWWHILVQLPARDLTIEGRTMQVPKVYEDLIICVKPHKAIRHGDVNREVDFNSVQEVCKQLITGLNIMKARFDPWNTAQMVQGLQSTTGADVDVTPFSQPEQFKRGRLFKSMLYANLLSLLPNDIRDKEIRRLQRIGNRIDHPEGGSKDLYDTEAILVWEAVTWSVGKVDISL
jgi:hypothetical protein